MKKLILNIVTLGLLFGVAVVNRNSEPKHLEVQDVLTEKEEKIGNKTRKYANETPEFKVSEVKAQVSEVYQDAGDNDRINIRFVAGIDTYTYSNAKFNLTIKDGETLVKEIEKPITVAYSAIEVNNDVLTAAEVFGSGYNYMISYALKNVPSSAWDYTFEVTAGVKTEESDYVNSEVATKNIKEIQAEDEISLPSMYIFGTVFNGEAGWSNSTQMKLVAENTYEITADFAVGTYIVCEEDAMTTTKSKLKATGNKNFEILEAGNYTFTITRNDMSGDTKWTKTTEVNTATVTLPSAYYKFARNFEPSINNLYLCGNFIGGWDKYKAFTKVSDTLYEVEITLSAEGGLIAAQQRRDNIDLIFKYENGADIKVPEAGKYKVSVSLVEQDDTWTPLVDVRKNYSGTIYFKAEIVVEEYENIIKSGVTGVGASSEKQAATYAFDSSLSTRWETNSADPQWIKFDFKGSYDVYKISIDWYGRAAAKNYVIYYTNDTSAYENFAVVKNEDGSVNFDATFANWNKAIEYTYTAQTQDRSDSFSVENADFESFNARYMVVLGTSRVWSWGYSIKEIAVLGK